MIKPKPSGSFYLKKLSPRRVKKLFFFKIPRVSKTISKLGHFRFGLVSKKVNLVTFLGNFRGLTLKAEKHQAIKHLIYLKTYRGVRHARWLPVRGQSARTNAKTRRKWHVQ